MRAVFLGTPAFAVPSLEALAGQHEILAVYTQPDRPKGRGQELAGSPVKEAARRLGISEIRQPERIRKAEVAAGLAALDADIMVVVGYGQIIPQAIIDLPRYGIVNVHASLLPKYRGAAPIQWAIANGETVTGVTTMQIDAGLDTGAMLLRRERGIAPSETALTLSEKLSRDGAELLLETLASLERGTIVPEPQDPAAATLAPILKKEDGQVDWRWPASKIHNRSRGFLPWPGTWTTFRAQRMNLWSCFPAAGPVAVPGQMLRQGKQLFVGCGEQTVLELAEVQLEGRKRVPVEAFLNGVRLEEGERLG